MEPSDLSSVGTAEERVVFPSRSDQKPTVIDAILAQARHHQYPETSLFAIRLALDEAISNAIHHGNHDDPARRITLSYSVTPERVRVRIEDEGGGFTPECLADPTRDENLTCPCGRGVMLMKAYMSQVEFNEAGNRVTLIKTRDDC